MEDLRIDSIKDVIFAVASFYHFPSNFLTNFRRKYKEKCVFSVYVNSAKSGFTGAEAGGCC